MAFRRGREDVTLPTRMAGRMFISNWWRDLLQRHSLDSVESVWNSKSGAALKSAPST